jgi:D-arginine dehydrogenase
MRPRVLVLGAGVAGLSVAAGLAGAADTIVVDRALQAGAGATAQNAGMVRVLCEDPVERALAIRTARRLAEPDLSPHGRVVGALLGRVDDPQHLNDAVAGARAAGVVVHDAPDAAAFAPIASGARLRRAWWVPDARVVDAHGLVGALAARAGADLRLGLDVQRLVVRDGRCVGVGFADGSAARADVVVLAAGAWCATLAATAGLNRPLIPVRRHLLVSAPHPLARPDHPWVWLDDVGLYVRPEAGGWLGSPCDEQAAPPPPDGDSQGPVDAARRALWLDKIERHLPSLAGVRPVGGWTGLRTFAPDRRPMIGLDPDLPGLAWCAGLGGFGVSAGIAAGEAAAAWVLGEEVAWLSRRAVDPGRRTPSRWTIRPDGVADHARIITAALPVSPRSPA